MHKRELFVILVSIILGIVGVYSFRGGLAATFAFFFFFAILTAVTSRGLKLGVAVALFCALITLPGVLADPILGEAQNYILYVTLHISLPLVFAFLAFQLVHRYNLREKEVADLSSSRVRMARALDEELTRLQLLYQISQKLHGEFQMGEVGPVALDALLKVVHAKACSIWLFEKSSGKLACIGAKGIFEENWREVRLSPGEGVAGIAYQENRAVRIDKLEGDPRWSNVLHRTGKFHCAIGVPLTIKKNPIGAISFLDKIGEEVFSDSDEKVLGMLASRIGVLIENTSLYQELRGQLGRVSSLLEVAKHLIEVVDLQKIFQVVVESALRVCDGDAGYLLLKNIDDVLEPKAYVGVLPGFAETLKLRVGEGISGRVAETGESVAVLSFQDLLQMRTKEIHWEDIASAIWVPILLAGKPEGVMCIYRKRERSPFDEESQGLLETLAGLAALAIEKSRLYEDLLNTNVRAVQALAVALDARDPSSARKQHAAASLMKKFSEHLELPEQEKRALEFAACLYDIGKLGVPEEILRKTGPLSEEEIAMARKHVHIGADIVGTVDSLKDAVPYVFLHHERVDGKGYPLGLKGEDIPRGARILAVVDSYLAMRQKRPYRKALSHEEAMAQIRHEKGRAYDPNVVDVLEQILSTTNGDFSSELEET